MPVRKDEVEALYHLTRRLLYPDPETGAAALVTAAARRIMNGRAAVLCLAGEADGVMRVVAADGAAADGSVLPEQPCLAETGAHVTPMASVPLAVAGTLPGCMCVQESDSRLASPEGMRMLREVAAVAALVLGRERRLEQTWQRRMMAERSRTAQELHGGICQSLGYVYLQLRLLEQQVGRKPTSQIESDLGALAGVTGDAFDQCRSLIAALRSPNPGRS